MAANNIGIRHVPGIGVADIDVYDTNRRKYDKFPDKYAEKVKIRIGVFFDGTGNNSYNSDAVYYRQTLPLQEDDVPEVRHKGFEVENGASYWNPYTNIKLLHDLYEEKTKRDDSKNIIFQQIQLKVYIQGIGTLRDEKDDVYGSGFGEGDRGVIKRVEQGCLDIVNAIKKSFDELKKDKPLAIESLQFDVFGFSRGAAAARHFCNEVLKHKMVDREIIRLNETTEPIVDKRKDESYLSVKDNIRINRREFIVASKKEFTGGKLGELFQRQNIQYPAKNVTVEFLGLYDTVISQMLEVMGVIDVSRSIPLPSYFPLPKVPLIAPNPLKTLGLIKKVNPDVSHPNLKKVFHITASDEWRKNFPYTPISNYANGGSLSVLGAHSDVGGGYWQTEKEIKTLHFFDVPLDRYEDEIDEVNDFMSELRNWYINNWYCKNDESVIYWKTMHHVEVYKNALLPPLVINKLGTVLLEEEFMGSEIQKIVDNQRILPTKVL